MLYRVGTRRFTTLQGAKNYANRVFEAHKIVIGITQEAKPTPALQKIIPMPAFPSIRK
jgi:hypothetical protein